MDFYKRFTYLQNIPRKAAQHRLRGFDLKTGRPEVLFLNPGVVVGFTVWSFPSIFLIGP